MPGMSGIELARTLAPDRPSMRIVVMSGYTKETLSLDDIGAPAVLVTKPFKPSDLQRKIEEVLGQPCPAHDLSDC